jgi:hypothetical protein
MAAKNNGSLHEGLCTFMIISHSIILRITNISDKLCRENQNSYFKYNDYFSENRAFMIQCVELWWRQSGHR